MNAIKNLFKDIQKIIYHSSLLLSGSVIAQLISVVTYPFLTRLYSPAQFGEFSAFLSIAGVLAIASTGRFEYALMLPAEEKEADDLKTLGLRWCFVFCALLLFIVLVTGQLVKPSNIPGLYFIPFYVFFTGIFQLFTLYRNRQKAYKKLAQVTISQNIAAIGSKLILGISGILSKGLIIGSSVGQFIAVLFISRGLSVSISPKRSLKAVFDKYAVFPKYRMVQALTNAFSVNLPILFITYYYTTKQAGFFAIILGLGYKVITLVASSLYQVLYQQFTEFKMKRQAMLPVFRKMLLLLLGLTILGGIPLFIFSTPLITLYFGSNWAEAGLYMRIMLPWLAIVFVISPFFFIADIFSLQKQVLIFDIIHLLLRVAGLYVGLLQKNVYLSVKLYCLSSIIYLSFIIVWYFMIVKKQDTTRYL